jgi:uncharacterized RDD family membrane protein YckC
MREKATLRRQFAAIVYEGLTLLAIWLVCTFIFVLIIGEVDTSIKRLILQLLLWMITGVYFVFCWHKTGQTLAAQAWKIKLVKTDAELLSIKQSIIRYCLASISFFGFGFGFLWAIVDKERLFLHDRLVKSVYIKAVKS